MGKSVYFSDDELIEIETALEGHESSDADDMKIIESAFYKVGLALERPWALAKQQQRATEKDVKS